MNDVEFERRLRASLRYGAEQVGTPDVGFDPLTVDEAFEDEVRAGLRAGATRPLRRRSPVIPRRHRARRWVFDGLAAAAVVGVVALALGLGVFARDRDRSPGPVGSPSPAARWRVDIGLVRTPAITPVSATEFTAPAHSRVTLAMTVGPAHPDGKTYLYRSLDGGPWTVIGPHNTDATSRELLRVPTPAAGHVAVYRIYVAPANGYAGTYSGSIHLHGA